MTAVFLFTACKKDDTVNVLFNFQNLQGTTAKGRAYVIDPAKNKLLFSNFEYVDAEGNVKLVKDAFLLKSSDNGFSFKVPSGSFSSFKFYFGLDKATNNAVPMSFPASSPLSVESGMYWDMLKYRFLIVEGDIDNSSTKDQTPAAPFSMHLGTDTMYAEIPVTGGVPMGGSTLQINLDMSKLFVLDEDTFEISNFSNHSSPSEIPNGVAIRNSFVNGISATVLRPE